MWFAKWAEQYSTIFGLDSDAELKMVLSWESTLSRLYTRIELAAAADWLLAHPEAFAEHRSRADRHLVALHQAVREIRALEGERSEKAIGLEEWGECTLCSSTGCVAVPRLEDVVDGQWRPVRALVGTRPVYRLYLVACSCKLGEWKNERRRPGPLLLALERCTAQNPDWRRQLEAQRAEAVAWVEAHGQRNGPLDSVLAKLAERFGLG